jgi:hypothetical protein
MIVIIIISVLLNLLLGVVILILFMQQRVFRNECNMNIEKLTKENSNLIQKVLSILKE